MASLTFLHNKNFTLSSDSLVYDPEEVNTLQSILEQATTIHQLLDNEEKLVEQAKELGYSEGYESGQTTGYEAALEHIATKLVTLAKEANATREELRQSAGDVAIKIVEKIACDIGPEKTVKSLALSAAKELTPVESIVLHVHPDNKEYLISELSKENNTMHKIVEVMADPMLEQQDCILETEYGHIRAGLQTQLKVMRDQFYER